MAVLVSSSRSGRWLVAVSVSIDHLTHHRIVDGHSRGRDDEPTFLLAQIGPCHRLNSDGRTVQFKLD